MNHSWKSRWNFVSHSTEGKLGLVFLLFIFSHRHHGRFYVRFLFREFLISVTFVTSKLILNIIIGPKNVHLYWVMWVLISENRRIVLFPIETEWNSKKIFSYTLKRFSTEGLKSYFRGNFGYFVAVLEEEKTIEFFSVFVLCNFRLSRLEGERKRQENRNLPLHQFSLVNHPALKFSAVKRYTKPKLPRGWNKNMLKYDTKIYV